MKSTLQTGQWVQLNQLYARTICYVRFQICLVGYFGEIMDKLKESIWNCLVGADGVSCSIESITVSKGLTDLMYVDAATGNYCGAVISRQLTIENIRRKH